MIHVGWAVWWGILAALVVVSEIIALCNPRSGDTLSEMVWAIYNHSLLGKFACWMMSAFQLWLLVHFLTKGKAA